MIVSQIDTSNGTCLPLPNQLAACTTYKIIYIIIV